MDHPHSHNYPVLVRRWKRAARAASLEMAEFASSGGFEILALRSSSPVLGCPSLYLSAGIHGDEPAATEALVGWAEKNPALLRSLRLLLFPCLNPWGLVHNCRLDPRGRDLNRCYNKRRPLQIREQVRLIGKETFDLALMLHEDYDARGIYIYEAPSKRPYWAEDLLRAASPFLPPDTRGNIEGRKARRGVVRRRIFPDTIPDWPEAFFLHFGHAARTFTVETPSECDIGLRVAAHEAVLQVATEALLAGM